MDLLDETLQISMSDLFGPPDNERSTSVTDTRCNTENKPGKSNPSSHDWLSMKVEGPVGSGRGAMSGLTTDVTDANQSQTEVLRNVKQPGGTTLLIKGEHVETKRESNTQPEHLPAKTDPQAASTLSQPSDMQNGTESKHPSSNEKILHTRRNRASQNEDRFTESLTKETLSQEEPVEYDTQYRKKAATVRKNGQLTDVAETREKAPSLTTRQGNSRRMAPEIAANEQCQTPDGQTDQQIADSEGDDGEFTDEVLNIRPIVLNEETNGMQSKTHHAYNDLSGKENEDYLQVQTEDESGIPRIRLTNVCDTDENMTFDEAFAITADDYGLDPGTRLQTQKTAKRADRSGVPNYLRGRGPKMSVLNKGFVCLDGQTSPVVEDPNYDITSVLEQTIPTPTDSIRNLVLSDAEMSDGEDITSEICLINKDASGHHDYRIDFGMKVRSYQDAKRVMRHVVYSINDVIGHVSIAKKLKLAMNDELLLLNQTRLIGRDQWDVVEAFANLPVNCTFSLITRRRLPRPTDTGRRYEFRKTSARIRIKRQDQHAVAVVTDVDLFSSTEPDKTGLVMVQLRYVHDICLAAADNATYLKSEETGVCFQGGLTDDPSWLFEVSSYAGFHPTEGYLVTFIVIKSRYQGSPLSLTASSETSLTLKPYDDKEVTPGKTPDSDVCFQLGRIGRYFTLKSLKYSKDNMFLYKDNMDLVLRQRQDESDRLFMFYLRHDRGRCSHCPKLLAHTERSRNCMHEV